MPERIRLCPPIDTEVDTINQCRRTFRQIARCLAVNFSDAGPGQTLTAHDHPGGLELTDDPQVVPFDTLDTDTGDLFEFDPLTSEVTVTADAEIAMVFRASMMADGMACVRIWLEEDVGGGSGFMEVDGTRAYMWVGEPPAP